MSRLCIWQKSVAVGRDCSQEFKSACRRFVCFKICSRLTERSLLMFDRGCQTLFSQPRIKVGGGGEASEILVFFRGGIIDIRRDSFIHSFTDPSPKGSARPSHTNPCFSFPVFRFDILIFQILSPVFTQSPVNLQSVSQPRCITSVSLVIP